MIDLNQLESEIDDLLASETSDSLLSWLLEKRISDMKKRLGEGVFEPLTKINVTQRLQNKSKVVALKFTIEVKPQPIDEPVNCFDIAA